MSVARDSPLTGKHATEGGLYALTNVAADGADADDESAREGDLLRHAYALAWSIALALAATFLIVFVVQLPRNIAELSWNPDYASGFTLPETLARTGAGDNTVISSAGQWVSLWFGLLTAKLPLHRQLWGVAPTLLLIVTAAAVGWSVSKVAGARAGILAVLLSLVISARALWFFMAPVAHNTVYPCTALTGAYLIWLAHGEGRRRAVSLAAPPLLGVVVGVCLASDVLLAAAAIVPLACTAMLAGLRRNRASRLVGLSGVVTVAVAIPTSLLTARIMSDLGYRTLPTPAKLAALSELPARARLLFKGLKDLFNGYLGPPAANGLLHAPIGIASTIVMSIGLLVLVYLGTATGIRFIAGWLHEPQSESPATLSRALHVIYWVSAAAAASGAFWLAAEGPSVTHESYYGTVIFAMAAVIPLLLAGRWLARLLLPVGASVIFAGSLAGLTSNYLDAWAIPGISPVSRIAHSYGVRTGYSGYSQASNLTWRSHGRVTIRPVMLCVNPGGADVCPFLLARTPAWYVPRQRRSFLLVHLGEAWLGEVPPGLGRPLAAYSFGSYRMYIYRYDIAARFGPLQ